MSAAVLMSSSAPHYYSSPSQVSSWLMYNQMASNYPPVPTPDHYNGHSALYPTQGGAPQQQQLLDQAQHEPLQYTNLNSPIYPKVESNAHTNPHSPIDASHQHHAANIANELQHQVALEEQQRQQIQAAHHYVSQGPTSGNVSAAHHQHQGTPEQAQKTNRLRKACDSCSIRKVKCDETGPPCRACAALDIPCTFDRPSRRRGPPNRHAEAIKRRRLEEAAGESPHFSGAGTGTSSPSSPTHAAQALASMSSHTSGQTLSAQSICPIETLDLLIDDFFTYIHPLTPFPHEPSFREAWKRREDLSNKPFLALLSSMVCALVASFPRKPRLHFKAQRKERMFPNHMSLVSRCQQVCAAARGIGYLEREELNVYDAATSYFLGLSGVYTFRWKQGRLYMGECLAIIRTLGLHKHKQPSGTQSQAMSSNGSVYDGNREPVDNITQEMGRRIFWTMFVSLRTVQQLGTSYGELIIPPPTQTEPYPPLPSEIDDFCIFPSYNEPQPPGLLAKIAGFNANVNVFGSYNALATMELAWGVDTVVDFERQKRVLYDSLQRCKKAISDLPSELIVYPNAGNVTAGPFDSHPGAQQTGNAFFSNFTPPAMMSRDPAHLILNTPHRPEGESVEDQRRMQYEIQKANIYASSLATRSYVVEKYFNLCDAQSRSQAPSSRPNSPGTGTIAAGIDAALSQSGTGPTSGYDHIGDSMHQERESIMKDLLVVLSTINQVNMEPNGDSFTMKIRSIAGTLLDASDSRKGQLAMQAQEYLAAFLKILVRLERVSPANSDPDEPEDEEAELRHWADLQEFQMKFAQQGGLWGVA